MNLSIIKALRAALLAACTTVGMVAPSQSAVIVLSYDPAYGAAFPALGWRVTADLYVPESCTFPVFLTRFSPPGCGATAVRNTVLHFYNLGDPSTTVERLTLGDFGRDQSPLTLNPLQETQELIGVSQLFGQYLFQTTNSLRVQAFDLIAGAGSSWFSLSLNDRGAELMHFTSSTQTVADARARGQFSTGEVTVSMDRFAGRDQDYVPPTFAAVVPTQRVPEPASGILAVSALAWLGWTRRRRLP